MKKYPKYKDSGVSWIGEIPEHWKFAHLRNYLKLVSDKGHPNEILLSVTRDRGVIIRNVDSKEENHNFIPDDLSGYKLVKVGQFAINKMKSWQGSYAVSEYQGIVSPAYYICDLNFPYKKFFSIAIRSRAYIPFFTQYSKGIRVDQWDLSPIALKSIPFIEPPLPEQQAIVSFLDAKTAQIDRFISEATKEIEKLNELKQAQIAHLVMHGTNPDAPMKDSNIVWIGQVPEHWEVRKMKFLFDERTEKNHPEEPILCATQAHGVIPQSMYDNRVVVVNTGFQNLKFVEVGDFVISLRSFQGGIEYAHYQGIISAAYTILRSKGDLTNDYTRYLFKSFPFIQLLKTCVKGIREGQNINYDMLKNNYLFVPPKQEQTAIVSAINSLNKRIDMLTSQLVDQINHLKELKQRIISDAVTGKIDVREVNN
ncbi:restriction endonuclease subunit S [Prevotella histicola]|jgi:type I restriction enzyme S subunit